MLIKIRYPNTATFKFDELLNKSEKIPSISDSKTNSNFIYVIAFSF